MSPYFYTINYTFLSHIIFKLYFVQRLYKGATRNMYSNNGYGKKVLKAVIIAVIFGLVAGGVFAGVTYAADNRYKKYSARQYNSRNGGVYSYNCIGCI